MNFGLGLVLSFTDNATAGINNAVDSLGRLTQIAEDASTSLNQMASLSALSAVSAQIGDSFYSMGSTIISTLGQVVKQVTDTGTTLMYAGNQLQMLYSDLGEGAGEMMLGKIQQYAKESIFAFEDLIPVVTSLKSVGIEAFDEIATSSGSARQTLMDYASDLAAFAPQMRNAYGTGIKAAMGALREYIAEGNVMSLKRGAGIDITSILGEAKGGSIEERSQQVADLIDKLGMLGMTASLAGTPMQRLSNMGDVLFQTIAKISESGVYDKFSSIITKISDYVFAIPDEELQNIAQVVGDALVSIMNPLDKVVDKLLSLADGVRALVANNPKLVKFAVAGISVVGVMLLIAGVALRATSALSGLSLMFLASGKSFSSLGAILKTGFKSLLATLLPIIATLALLYGAWKIDFAGIRTITTSFVKNVTSSFSTASKAIKGDVSDMTKTLDELSNKDDFFSNFTISIMKMMQVVKSLAQAWGSNTLSEENYQKAKELGVLPLIEAMLDLKYRFDFFKQGFVDGWRQIGDAVSSVVSNIADKFDGTFLQSFMDRIAEFLGKLSDSDVQKWYDFGNAFASITAKAVGVFAIFAGVKKIGGVIGGLYTLVKPLISLVVANPVVGIILGVIGALALLYKKSESFRDLVHELFGTIQSAIGGVIEPMKEMLTGLFNEMYPLILKVIDSVRAFLPQVASYLSSIISFVMSLLGSISELVVGLMPAITQVIGTIMSAFMSLMPTLMSIFSTVMNVVQSLLPIITKLVNMVVPFIVDLANLLGQLVSNVMPIIVDLINTIMGVVTNLLDLIMPMISRIIEALLPIIQSIMNIVTCLVSKLMPVIQTVADIASKIIKMVLNILTPIITVIMQIVEVIVSILLPIIDVIVVAIGFVIDIIMGIVNVVVSVIGAIVSVITGIVNVIMSIINVIVQAIMSVVSVIVGIVTTIIETISTIIKGIIYTVQSVWSTITGVFSGAIDFFSGIFSAVFDVVSGIFNKIADFFTNIWNGITGAFSKLGDTISGAIRGAINGVLSGAIGIINGFIKAINLAIGVINAIPGVEIKKLNLLEVPKLAKGGVVDQATLSMIGEQGKEAVVPLENNTEWTGQVANLISNAMRNRTQDTRDYGVLVSVISSCIAVLNKLTSVLSSNDVESTHASSVVPVSTNSTTNQNNNSNSYMTSTNKNVSYGGDTDNSITFAEGSIVIHANGASDAEAERMARKIMAFIKRQKELEDMLDYA